MSILKKTIKITATLHSGYVSYIREDTGEEVARNKSGVYAWAIINSVKVELDTVAQSATSYE